MAIRAFGKWVCLAMLLHMLMMKMVVTEAKLSCGQVVANLSPCVNYAHNGKPIPFGCCASMRQFQAAAKASEADLKTACACNKQIISVPGVQIGLVSGAPAKCGLPLPFKIDPSVDCSKLHWA